MKQANGSKTSKASKGEATLSSELFQGKRTHSAWSPEASMYISDVGAAHAIRGHGLDRSALDVAMSVVRNALLRTSSGHRLAREISQRRATLELKLVYYRQHIPGSMSSSKALSHEPYVEAAFQRNGWVRVITLTVDPNYKRNPSFDDA